jgi:hypothetical protein
MRSFIYLDKYKLYSFSSQLFGGLVNEIVKVSARGKGAESRADNNASPTQVVAEIASEATATAERRFMHDHAYELFEKELSARGQLVIPDAATTIDKFYQPCFLKASGPATFMDAPSLRSLIGSLNDLIDSFATMSSLQTIEENCGPIREKIRNTKDRNQIAKLEHTLKTASSITSIAEAMGRQDPRVLASVSRLLDFGYGEQFRLDIPVETCRLVFSASLDEASLREARSVLMQKYSKRTDRTVVVVGVPTQAGGQTGTSDTFKYEGMREAMDNLDQIATGLYAQFTGRMQNEVVLDPIAVYLEWDVPSDNPMPR